MRLRQQVELMKTAVQREIMYATAQVKEGNKMDKEVKEALRVDADQAWQDLFKFTLNDRTAEAGKDTHASGSTEHQGSKDEARNEQDVRNQG